MSENLSKFSLFQRQSWRNGQFSWQCPNSCPKKLDSNCSAGSLLEAATDDESDLDVFDAMGNLLEEHHTNPTMKRKYGMGDEQVRRTVELVCTDAHNEIHRNDPSASRLKHT